MSNNDFIIMDEDTEDVSSDSEKRQKSLNLPVLPLIQKRTIHHMTMMAMKKSVSLPSS